MDDFYDLKIIQIKFKQIDKKMDTQYNKH